MVNRCAKHRIPKHPVSDIICANIRVCFLKTGSQRVWLHSSEVTSFSNDQEVPDSIQASALGFIYSGELFHGIERLNPGHTV